MASRGKELEGKVNDANIKYRKKKLAVVQKLPLPVRITKKGAIPIKSTVDYIGSIGPDGKAIAFDAKETQSTTSFPFSNIKQHQETFLKYFGETGGKAGFLIWFKKVDEDEAFFTPIDFIKEFKETETRKSIPYERFKDEFRVPLDDYLELITNEDDGF